MSKYLFIANRAEDILASCSGAIWDLTNSGQTVDVICASVDPDEAISTHIGFLELGVNESNITVASHHHEAQRKTYKLFVENEVLKINPDVVFLKHPEFGRFGDMLLYRLTLDNVSNMVSVYAFIGNEQILDIAGRIREEMVVLLSESAQGRKGDADHEKFVVIREIKKYHKDA